MTWKRDGIRINKGGTLDLGEAIILAKDVIKVNNQSERIALEPTVLAGTYVTEIDTGKTYLRTNDSWLEVTGNTIVQPLPDQGQLPGIGFLYRDGTFTWKLESSARSGSGW